MNKNKKYLLLSHIDNNKKKKRFKVFSENMLTGEILNFYSLDDLEETLGVSVVFNDNLTYVTNYKTFDKYIVFRNTLELRKYREKSLYRLNKVYTLINSNGVVVYNLKVHNSHLAVGLTGESVVDGRDIIFRGKNVTIKDMECGLNYNLENITPINSMVDDESKEIPMQQNNSINTKNTKKVGKITIIKRVKR